MSVYILWTIFDSSNDKHELLIVSNSIVIVGANFSRCSDFLFWFFQPLVTMVSMLKVALGLALVRKCNEGFPFLVHMLKKCAFTPLPPPQALLHPPKKLPVWAVKTNISVVDSGREYSGTSEIKIQNIDIFFFFFFPVSI